MSLGSLLPLGVSGDADRDRRGCGGCKGQWESHFLKEVAPKTSESCLQQEGGESDTWKDFPRGRRGQCLRKDPES